MAFVESKPHPVSKKYRAGYKHWNGKQVRFTGTTNPRETLAMARRFEDEHRQIRLGYRLPPKPGDAPRPFWDVANEYIAWGTAQGGHGGRPWNAVHVRMRTRHLMEFWPAQLNLKTVHDVTLPKVESVARDLLAGKIPPPPPKPGKKAKTAQPATGKTVQMYVESIKALCLWAKSRGYLESNPLEYMAGFDTTPKQKRRAMTADEIEKLLNAAPPPRRLVYEVALCTGYRKGELTALKVQDLNVEMCSLSLSAEFCKGRRASRQPLPHTLALKLKAASEGKPANAPLLEVDFHIDRLFFRDLTAAKLLEDAPGGKLVFHSLRHTYCSLVIESGATLTEAQRLLRHQDPQLTANVYSHARQDRLQSTAEAVGETVMKENSTTLLRHRLAAGAESIDVNALDVNECKNENVQLSLVRTPSPASLTASPIDCRQTH
ncbi:MAG TPA: tyrosine-type recombinase/integrase [Planctomycetota bacterium]|nr:tyrosine-type recombinase/integrase [Planctomycetota bacterium]